MRIPLKLFRHSTGKLVLVIAMLVVITPSAHADVAYTFLTTTCDPKAGTASINSFTLWDDEGKSTASSKDDLEIEPTNPSTKPIIVCKLGAETVKMAIHADVARSASDSISIFFNKSQGFIFSLAQDSTLKFSLLNKSAIAVRQCFRSKPGAPEAGDDVCSSHTYHYGRMIGVPKN